MDRAYVRVRPGNGAGNPSLWTPDYHEYDTKSRLVVGDLVAWRYAAWRVAEVNDVADVDLTDKQRAALDQHTRIWRPEMRAQQREAYRPTYVVLRHERGPFLIKPKEPSQRLHDGTRTVHLDGGVGRTWCVFTEPYRVCSCHGDPWPCQDVDQAQVAAAAAVHMDKLMATTEPGVCAHCLEPITTRQKTVTFPEPSHWVPGAPGPTFHAGRGACWHRAVEYERTGRLADNPDVARLASCPGVRFIHEARGLPAERRLECTAGPYCTGHHGPPGYRREIPCYTKHIIGMESRGKEIYPRPNTDCGYRRPGDDVGCLGRVVAGDDFSTALNEQAGDGIADVERRSPGGLLGRIRTGWDRNLDGQDDAGNG